jgi:hypothetical protein
MQRLLGIPLRYAPADAYQMSYSSDVLRSIVVGEVFNFASIIDAQPTFLLKVLLIPQNPCYSLLELNKARNLLLYGVLLVPAIVSSSSNLFLGKRAAN